jgi:hypothetical protein
MKATNIDDAIALVRKHSHLSNLINAIKSNTGGATAQLKIKYRDYEADGDFSKALVMSTLLDGKNTIKKELAELGVEI